MTSNGSYNLTVDGELRYVVQWFEEWSDFQREDFVPYLVSYMVHQNEGSAAVYVNGLISAMAQINPAQDKPMSLFQCRVKLFNEWSNKWPAEFKTKLLERLEQIDGTFGSRVRSEMNGTARPVNGCQENPATPLQDASPFPTGETLEEDESAGGFGFQEPAVVVTAAAVLVADED